MSTIFKKLKTYYFLALVFFGVVFSFQNCSRTKFIAASDSLGAEASVDPLAASASVPKYCKFNGVKYNENESIDAYQYQTVPPGESCPTEKRICKSGNFTGSFSFPECHADSGTTFQLSLSHTFGHRDFSVSSVGLAITNSLCKVQYEKNKLNWVDLTPDFSCASGLSNKPVFLPSADRWNDSFDLNGVKIRLIKSNDQSLVAVFPQSVTCQIQAGSDSTTPDVDENCNTVWDDSVVTDAYCDIDSGGKPYGSSYSCSPTLICGNNKTASFLSHVWMNASSYYKVGCETETVKGALSYGLQSSLQSGRVPYSTDRGIDVPTGCSLYGSANYIFINPSGWDYAKCSYAYTNDPKYF